MENYIQQFIELVDGVKITLLMALIVTNFVTGIAVAIKNKVFNLKQMGDFLYSRVLPYVIGYFGMGILAVIDNFWAWAITAIWAIILATLVGAILQNIKELGINIPNTLTGHK